MPRLVVEEAWWYKRERCVHCARRGGVEDTAASLLLRVTWLMVKKPPGKVKFLRNHRFPF
jgi:hypothetical protein